MGQALSSSLKLEPFALTFFGSRRFNLQSHPTFHSVERLANLKRGRECFVCLSILLLVYAASRCQLILANSHVVTHAAQPYLQNVIQVQHKNFRYLHEYSIG